MSLFSFTTGELLPATIFIQSTTTTREKIWLNFSFHHLVTYRSNDLKYFSSVVVLTHEQILKGFGDVIVYYVGTNLFSIKIIYTLPPGICYVAAAKHR